MSSRLALRLLIVSSVVILGLVIFRERQMADWRLNAPPPEAASRQLAPRFELADHHRHLVKFERFLGRQRVVLVFFDAAAGADHDPRLERLVNCFESLRQARIEVVAVSDATPYANQRAEEKLGREFPFPLLTDIDPKIPISHPVHRLWGRFDETSERTRTGMFLIARDGTVPIGPDGQPLPVENDEAALGELCQGQWPS